MPRFSIVMPTRNRAGYLGHAIQSALEQRFEDLEVVVSNNDSSDETREVVHCFDDPRLRYVETSSTLAMPDSWEFAMTHARGEYVTVLCDDDALTPSCCARADHHLRETPVELLYWRRFHYNLADWIEESKRNTVKLAPTTGEATLEATRPWLESWYRGCRYMLHAPMLFNGFFSRERLEEIRERAGRFFLGPAPDVGASLMMLGHTDQMLKIDHVMGLVGAGRQSIGANQDVGGDTGVAEDFEKEFHGKIFTRIPFRMNMITTTVADTLLAAQELLPERFAEFEFDLGRFYLECYREVSDRGQRGQDVERPLAELARQMDALDATLRARADVEARRQGRKAMLKEATGYLRRRLPGALWPGKTRVVRGADAGFSNILECARRLDEMALGRRAAH